MTIEIDTDVLKDLDISADDFVYLYLLHAKAYDVIHLLKPDTEALQRKGLIKVGEEPEDNVVRQKFIDTIEDNFDRMWSDLLSHFPIKVYNQGQVRVLRISKHKKIVQCLINELEFRKTNNQIGYMQMLQTWVNGHSWEKYEDVNVGRTEEQERRITRKL
jgi:hypothetical protein